MLEHKQRRNFSKKYSLNYVETKICQKETVVMYNFEFINSKSLDSVAMPSSEYAKFGPGIFRR